MIQQPQVISFEGDPYFIHERQDGLFYIINAYELCDDRSELLHPVGEGLKIGRDIKETSSGITLLVSFPKHMLGLSYVIGECRKYAAISRHDYVSYGELGYILPPKAPLGRDVAYVSVTPRLFSEIVKPQLILINRDKKI